MLDRDIIKKATGILDAINKNVDKSSFPICSHLVIRTHGLQVDDNHCEIMLRMNSGCEVQLCVVPRFSMSKYGKNKVHVNNYIDAVRNIYYQTFGEAIGFEWEHL